MLAYQRYGARQGAGVHRARLLAVADARRDPARGHDAREPLAPAPALAGERRARAGEACAVSPTASRPAASVTRARPTVSDETYLQRQRRPGGGAGEGSVRRRCASCRSSGRSSKDGEYRGTLQRREKGRHDVRVEARARPARRLGSDTVHVAGGGPGHRVLRRRDARGRCWSGSPRRRAAASTRPRPWPRCPRTSATAAAARPCRSRSALWDMPVLFLAIVALRARAEWAWRKRRGLA